MKETGLLPATNHWDETAEPLLITKGSDLKYYVGDVWVKFSRTEGARISEKVLKGSALRCSAAWIWGCPCPGTQIALAAKRSVCKMQVWEGKGSHCHLQILWLSASSDLSCGSLWGLQDSSLQMNIYQSVWLGQSFCSCPEKADHSLHSRQENQANLYKYC